MTILRQPTRAGVRDAAAKIAAILPPTPLLVAEVRGVPVMFKAESLQPIGAFKIRGAWHRLTAIDSEQRAKGVVAFKLAAGKPQAVMVKRGASDGSSTEVSGRDIKEGDLIISGERAATESK